MKSLILVIVVIAMIILAACAAPSTTPALQSEPPIEEGWVRLRIGDVG